ncbi:hypothetical protein BO78DRAFT_437947 [Aspergillus sclerotiicarbonarius CBS 121057]|uniref:Uncharacterized protein n=1 Tax=Aspergillus sclerotiicarbonarius (strain CBS 121057 / IBT 28362) TaxID=1448318 RepID=A0A319EXD8_ASPSB|nr:hypothetical protein BO78DRAFT_437947 [Aspergillus sclerotiicarbonarius CBS 121057]
MTGPNWEVTFFEITTTRRDRITDTLYANGLMQVPVDISIKATVDDRPYSLSEEELSSIKLVRYVAPDEALSDGWEYTASENDFDHVMPASAASATPNPEIKSNHDTSEQAASPNNAPAADRQVKRYWVTTTKVANEQIAASIQAPSGDVITTHGDDSGFDSCAALTGVAPIVYYEQDLLTDKYSKKEDTETHKWSAPHGKAHGKVYEQNVYVSLKNGRMHKAEVTGVKRDDEEYWFNHAYRRHVPTWVDNALDIHYAWDTGDTKHQWVGQPLPHSEYVDAKWQVETNMRQHKFNLARCAIRTEDTSMKLWSPNYNWEQHNSIILFDRCGNSGRFKAKYDNDWDKGGSRLVGDD